MNSRDRDVGLEVLMGGGGGVKREQRQGKGEETEELSKASSSI
jgi:hypothetical protein